MNIPSTVRTYLANSGLRFKGRQVEAAESFEATMAKAEIPLSRVVKPVLLKARSESGHAYLTPMPRGNRRGATDPDTVCATTPLVARAGPKRYS